MAGERRARAPTRRGSPALPPSSSTRARQREGQGRREGGVGGGRARYFLRAERHAHTSARQAGTWRAIPHHYNGCGEREARHRYRFGSRRGWRRIAKCRLAAPNRWRPRSRPRERRCRPVATGAGRTRRACGSAGEARLMPVRLNDVLQSNGRAIHSRTFTPVRTGGSGRRPMCARARVRARSATSRTACTLISPQRSTSVTMPALHVTNCDTIRAVNSYIHTEGASVIRWPHRPPSPHGDL